MKDINLRVDDILIDFYKKVAENSGKPLEIVMSDALKRFAFDACRKVNRLS